VVVEIKPGAIPVRQRYYYILRKAQIGIQKHLDRVLKYGILQPCQSLWNTFRTVQDLCAVNSATITLYSPHSPKLVYFLVLSQLRQSSLPALRIYFSASTWSHRDNPSLTSSGKVRVLEKRDK
jgi:hypothetical protein